ncbi:MAG: hypothetical protein RXQ62_05925 [Nitrososphaeria archaeon]
MRLSKKDIPEIAFYAFFSLVVWLIILPIPLAIPAGVAFGIGLVCDEKLFEEEDP